MPTAGELEAWDGASAYLNCVETSFTELTLSLADCPSMDETDFVKPGHGRRLGASSLTMSSFVTTLTA